MRHDRCIGITFRQRTGFLVVSWQVPLAQYSFHGGFNTHEQINRFSGANDEQLASLVVELEVIIGKPNQDFVVDVSRVFNLPCGHFVLPLDPTREPVAATGNHCTGYNAGDFVLVLAGQQTLKFNLIVFELALNG